MMRTRRAWPTRLCGQAIARPPGAAGPLCPSFSRLVWDLPTKRLLADSEKLQKFLTAITV